MGKFNLGSTIVMIVESDKKINLEKGQKVRFGDIIN